VAISDAAKRLVAADQPRALGALLAAAAAACHDVLANAALAAPPQALLQAYVRLQHLRGGAGGSGGGPGPAAPTSIMADAGAAGPGAAAAGAAATRVGGGGDGGGGLPRVLENPTVVLAAIEAIGAVPAPRDAAAAAKLEQVRRRRVVACLFAPILCALLGAGGAMKGWAGTPNALPHCTRPQSLRVAMGLLSQVASPNVELWARLARAAAGRGLWDAARECAEAARGALPPALQEATALARAKSAAAAPGLCRADWFWLAVAEMQAGQVGGWQRG
jgi:hypothetical protein